MYGLISDTHCHNWTQMFKTNDDGVNSRLRFILNEIERAAQTVKEQGGEYLLHAGDLFHVRGYIAPSVLNPTLAAFKRIIDMGIKPIILCGNHDAEFKDTNDLGSAIGALAGIGCRIINEPTVLHIDGKDVICVPWFRDNKEFLSVVSEASKQCSENCDLICHVALNGVFSHIDGSVCVNPADLFEAGNGKIARIFAGHLHNHLRVEKNVYSIGAIAQHTWGDATSKAGFMIVRDDKAEFIESNAPRFYNLTGKETEEELKEKADGNYVRANVSMSEAEIIEFRGMLEKFGARAVTMIVETKQELNLQRMEIQTTESLETIVSRYVSKNYDERDVEEVTKSCLEILEGVAL